MRRARLLLLVALGLSACWRGYGEIMRVHLDVLSGLAEKAAANAAAGQRPTSNDVTELTYPLQRARQFTEQYRHQDERESYRLFVAALDRYQRFVDTIDGARGDAARWTAVQPQLTTQYDAWRAAAGSVRAALDRER